MTEHISIEALYQLFIQCNQKITTDTRKLEPGAIFFALKGDNFDANTFAQEAIEKGCKYAIVDNPIYASHTNILLVSDVLEALQNLATHHRNQLNIVVIGITGSNAKTTHKELINAVLSTQFNVFATIGNLNNHIGVPLTLLSLNKNHEIAIVEMGANHQGEIAQLCKIANPNYGLITNIGSAHLEGFGGPEGVKKGKGELYQYIKNNSGKIFINADDQVLMNMAKDLEKITYGTHIGYNVYGTPINNSAFVEFSWNTKGIEIDSTTTVKTHLFGHYNFINLLCAVCIGNYLKISEDKINKALGSYIPEMNRSQVKKTDNNTLILDAYNANPSSMKLAIENFSEQNLENKVMILGDMFELGTYSNEEHLNVLLQLLKCDVKELFLVGSHFKQHQSTFKSYHFFDDIEALSKHLQVHKLKNCHILIKGSRGMKLEKITSFL